MKVPSKNNTENCHILTFFQRILRSRMDFLTPRVFVSEITFGQSPRIRGWKGIYLYTFSDPFPLILLAAQNWRLLRDRALLSRLWLILLLSLLRGLCWPLMSDPVVNELRWEEDDYDVGVWLESKSASRGNGAPWIVCSRVIKQMDGQARDRDVLGPK